MLKLYSLFEATEHRQGEPDPDSPVLVFLHGLLGQHQDWAEVRSRLTDFPRLSLDLPGHGQSRGNGCVDMDDCCEQIVFAIKAALQKEGMSQAHPLILTGYSLGGRIAMYGCVKGRWSSLNLKGLIIEGGHFGLGDEAARQQRWQHDMQWAARFRDEPVEQVLDDWYQQPVFSTLNDAQRQQLISQRRDNLGTRIAEMMLATSLARQPDLLAELYKQPLPVRYICGEEDQKFRQLAGNSRLSVYAIKQAGHNVHKEKSGAFTHALRECICSFTRPEKQNQ
ncbi:2-succinyl-6-hydroxy-2, 4-cyclohexadiene-1-carboxylate synthase [Vibrio aerogenes CECT 7868]|uniref:Putative 2-succinyl-6-hydroxy-2,4-cyclohexadiene-1-carboxylate synthase n=1 Tax=Vibrio aerogenes CECT 7868 TaxID=1216006 RepID=A0A1M5Y143_9VIBR|nr:2-succinyl-6-hydroxy-2,4-cyclohexadiene-1-carboxylate synthase [Vibrio aerogenes]SHI05243.1 2-succinyl-6-hydroxy-2, 4-cyclohexadiene-1-carboxylate synthase [Vibrio aerogenes CECT 7868]